MLRKTVRIILISLASLIGAIILFCLISIAPIDRTSYTEKSFFDEMMNRLDGVIQNKTIPPKSTLFIGFAKENITPHQHTAIAGYAKRRGKLFDTIHDSIFVRTMVVRTQNTLVAIVSVDLLIIPPTVTAQLEKRLPEIGFSLDNTFLGATHTHNSIGQWATGATTLLYGPYEDSIVHFITDKIITSIKHASQNTLAATLRTGQIPIANITYNRLDRNGRVDSLLRVIEIHRSDSSKLILLSHTAHATCLSSKNLNLSRDYPGKVVDTLEQQGYTFAMFMAGAVGSHSCKAPENNWNCVDYVASEMTTQFLTNRNSLHIVNNDALMMKRVPLLLGKSQVKISQNWRIRPWLFSTVFGEYPVSLTVLRLGDVVMLGTPCDFSGELNQPLDSIAAHYNLHTMVTSFNGGYIGYVTPLRHYDVNYFETRALNWYGPGTGEYMVTCMDKMIESVGNP